MKPDRPSRTHIEALRACGLHPAGMRYGAHLKSMQALQVLGYVEDRVPHHRRERRWFLTAAGKEVLAAIGTGEPREA